MKKTSIKPCVVGLGYVGLPLFLKLQKKIDTIGYDNNKFRITELIEKKDRNNEFSKKKFDIREKIYFYL